MVVFSICAAVRRQSEYYQASCGFATAIVGDRRKKVDWQGVLGMVQVWKMKKRKKKFRFHVQIQII